MTFSDPAVQLVLECMMDAFIVYDDEWRFSYVNKKAEDLMGHTREEVLGMVLWEKFPEIADSEFQTHFTYVAETGLSADFENFNPVTQIWLNLRAFKYPSGHVGVFWNDVTRQKSVEAELRKASEVALAASRAKSSFLANMSHEIRTPLNGVLATASLLLQMGLDPENQEYVELIVRSGRTLMRVIDDVLDMAKIEAGRMVLDSVAESPSRIVSDVIALHREQAGSLGLYLRAVYTDQMPERVLVDGTRLRQVLGNLVGNALKFTHTGGAEIRVSALEKSPDLWLLTLAVVDTGIGISPDHLESVFEAFVQADGTTYRRFGGTGLGLSISKQIVELMGGTLVVQSEFGVGSRFTIEIECEFAPAEDPFKLSIQTSQRNGIAVLLAEDNQVNAIIAQRTLERLNCIVTHVWDGFEAVEEASRSNFDLILLDVQMPNCDGLDACKLIRSTLDVKGTLIGAFTAGVTEKETTRCRDAGMDFVLGKPITFNQVRDLLVDRFPEQVAK